MRPHLLLACLLGLAWHFGMARGAGPNFAEPGPCNNTEWKATFAVPEQAQADGLPKTLPLTITMPSCS